jgi:hypothetical protein
MTDGRYAIFLCNFFQLFVFNRNLVTMLYLGEMPMRIGRHETGYKK